MTTKELLIAARARIAQPEHWTQRAYARFDDGCEAPTSSVFAVQWCAVGALMKEADWNGLVEEAKQALCDVGEILFPHEFNDSHTHAEVLALFDLAIAAQPTQE